MSFLDFQVQVNDAVLVSENKRIALKTARQKTVNHRRNKDQLLREIRADARDGDERLAAFKKSEVEFIQAVNAGKTAYAEAAKNEWAKLSAYVKFTNPVENIESLKDDCPILLFPLRLETRFKKIERHGEVVDQLWVRVFPDEIAINSFESDLSNTEVRNAKAYWLARWKAGKDVGGNRGAWRSLASAHGPGRAYWLISNGNYVPVNLANEPEKTEGEIILTIGTEDALAEPELSATIAYWQAVWQADKDSVRLDQAWRDLRTVVSEERAIILLKEYKPANIKDQPPAGLTRNETTVRVSFVIFKKTEELETKLHAWSQPPSANILPERFVFLAFQDGKPDMSPQLGNLV
ncbi:MAG: hypothetical protein GXP23_01440, partial [Gammaproteobacteria bacterium]|nr:hypothetical protein [Gammaproteobacteria bacterium]